MSKSTSWTINSLKNSTISSYCLRYHLKCISEFPEEYICTEEQILELLHSLDTKKSTGADSVSALMHKRCAGVIVPSITRLFNLSISSGTFLTAWKFAKIVPIPKRGDKKNPANYRSVSILPILSKLLEKHVAGLLQHELGSNMPLSACQWRFTAGKSTTTAFVCFCYIMEAADKGHEVWSVFFDVSI